MLLHVIGYVLAISGVFGLGIFFTRTIDDYRKRKSEETYRKYQRKKFFPPNAGGWMILLAFSITLTGCDHKIVTGKLIERKPLSENTYLLRFEDGTEWLVTDQGSQPWPIGQVARVDCSIDYRDGKKHAVVSDVSVVDSPKTRNPTGK